MHTPALLHFQLISPEKIVFSEVVSMVVLPGAQGAIGILPHHAPMILTLQSGVIEIFQSEEIKERIFVSSGFAEIIDTGCNVIADDAILVKDIHPDDLQAYIIQIMAEIEATPDIDERELLQQNLSIARAKMELFRRLRPINK
ncbi:MAG: ATP synthase F1 subunit epsilon [Alphaproteobacteria bacterium]|nr:ATP synthase F1 subunit epsilon [Alphaproteobacteria bacterium]